jgi:hypothetical protein
MGQGNFNTRGIIKTTLVEDREGQGNFNTRGIIKTTLVEDP